MKFFAIAVVSMLAVLSLDATQYPVPMMKKAQAARSRKKNEERVLPLQMAFEKIDDIHGVELTLPCYKIKTLNARPRMLYDLVSIDLAGKYRNEGEYSANKKGELQKNDAKGIYIAVLQGYQPAERVRYFLLSRDRKQKAETSIVPWPIHKENVSGQNLRADLINPSYTAFSIYADGYTPGEPLRIITYISGKVIETKGNATRHGTFNYLLMPVTYSEEDGGQLTFAIEGINSSNSIKLPWGTEFQKKGEAFIKRKCEEFNKLKEEFST